MKIVTVVGARPQFVKAAALSRVATMIPNVEEVLVHTGQHYDSAMSDIFFDELKIPKPRHYLGIGSGSHGAQTGRMLESIEKVLLSEKPDWVLLYGDTNSTLAGAIAASKLHIPVAHIEAGLRSFNRRMPEEINRILTDHCSDLLFSPTPTATQNLKNEGIEDRKIAQVGDIMLESVQIFSALAEKLSTVLTRLALTPKQYILTTIHRAENTDFPERLQAIIDALKKISAELPVVVPLHPRTKNKILEFGLDTNGLNIIDPVGYLDMLSLEKNAAMIASDSGGIQKEGYAFEVPCVTLRDETEWVELIELGWNRLAPPKNPDMLFHIMKAALGTRGRKDSSLGDGETASKIILTLADRLKNSHHG